MQTEKLNDGAQWALFWVGRASFISRSNPKKKWQPPKKASSAVQ